MKNLSNLSANENKKSVPKIFRRDEPDVCSECGEEFCNHDAPLISLEQFRINELERVYAESHDNQYTEE